MNCWINGQYVEESNLLISPFDHGFLYGLGFFEKFRTYNGKVVLFQEHFNRLCLALNQCRIMMPYTILNLQDVITELTKNAQGEDGIFCLIVSAGSAELSLQSKYDQPNVILFRKPLQQRKRGTEKVAQWLKTPRNTPEHISRVKSHHFGNNVFGRFEIENIDRCEGFFMTPKGFVAEGITSNVFWAKDGILYTPSLATGILPGITRQWLIITAKRLGYRVKEGLFLKSELEESFECFITNSIEELVPISKIGKVKFLGENGPIYQRFHHAYIEEIIHTMKRSTP